MIIKADRTRRIFNNIWTKGTLKTSRISVLSGIFPLFQGVAHLPAPDFLDFPRLFDMGPRWTGWGSRLRDIAMRGTNGARSLYSFYLHPKGDEHRNE